MSRSPKPMDITNPPEAVPQLSNEEQLRILNKVKMGEMTIQEALVWASKGTGEATKQTSQTQQQVESTSQYNFSVYKCNRYRWQKRILQIDFNSKVICSIEKGTVKKQFPFTQIKSCEDREGTRFSISFHDRQDYELEANSQEDKRKIMQLVNKVIYNNIYVLPTQVSSAVNEEPPKSGIIREGRLDLERGELASVKWVKYLVQLHEGELILQHTDHTTGIEDSDPSSTVIHISDGNASVEKQHGCDAFTVHTKKNEYQFRVPVSCQFKSTEEIKKERDEWVLAIDKFCLHWKRKSQFKPEDDGIYSVIQESRVMDIKDQVAEKEPVSPVSGNTPPPLQTSPSEPNAANAVFPQTPSSTQLPPSKLAQTVFQAPSPKSPATVPPPPECVTTPSIPAPPPPPPPPPPSLSLQSKSISTRTKAFHWDLLSQDKIPKSIWTQCNTEKIKIDADMLNDQFRVQELGTIAGVESATNHQILLNQKVAHNFNIFLRSFDVKPYELKEKLHIINAKDGGLTDEQISSLRRYVPTPDDIEMYKSYKGSPSELHVVDQYMMEMCNIPNLDNRLDLLLTIRELPISVDDLQPLINQMIKMCTQLRNSKSFVSVLKYLLVVGNYLNENAGKEKAKGFRLSSLTKLTQMRGKERKVTLLHALVQQIVLHEPDLAIFFQELTEFEDVPGASVKGLTAEVDVLKNELRKIIQHKKVLNKVLNKVNRETQFYKDLKTVLQKYEADLSQLTKKCDEMKKLYSDILVKFGEPQEQDSQELFGWVCSFISNFKRIYEEIIA
ncbi:uncharacterized protein LOC117412189 isoform X1 [Acipenser ruthenus]|uniref:uncharacterized protein LOC117412189 isoform X1 n=1 Tax=Acipenser ruthenus TaxID=7906 RepID=UPI00145B1639|nr:uncharacterized protein LOC117412189 isoform X1 [Acipenser ruthenus]